ncbi:MAG: hypothetical protein KKF89_04380 [Nanoarchaeota archaeon]|nr:hypothetical protein [Nanoarchaeota archaeon]
MLELISRKFNVDARFMYSNEILNLFDGIKPDIVIINKRKISYSVAMLDEKLTIFSYKKSLELNDFFTSILPKNLIKGVAANKGIVKGSAIICPMLNDSKEILKINKLMKKGDILIAETTSPDIIILCNKAAAIVTEQGGMLSHAVIISREMNIPCVIQATNSTKIFKNGDLVEVNADKGIVRKLN